MRIPNKPNIRPMLEGYLKWRGWERYEDNWLTPRVNSPQVLVTLAAATRIQLEWDDTDVL